MEEDARLTPDELIDTLKTLVKTQRFREAVNLTVHYLPEIRSQMTPEHAVRLHELMHVADMDDIPVDQHTAKSEAPAPATRLS